jgi:AraC family transcriptional regulator, dual regulator of chb operon
MVKVSCERGSPLGLHDHDYPELFWIEEGPCHHLINGHQDILETGDLVFVRAKDRHQFKAIGRHRFVMANLECHPRIINELKARHPHPFAGWFAEAKPMPLQTRLSSRCLQHIRRMAMDFAACAPDALHLESFLLDLAKLLQTPNPALAAISECPDWLRDALLRVEKPDVFSAGVPGFVQAAGRSAEHVSRTCKKHLGKTPTKIIEANRMKFAERQLRFTSDPITEISLACGYATTAQFYRSFRKHYGQTPLKYRRWLSGR